MSDQRRAAIGLMRLELYAQLVVAMSPNLCIGRAGAEIKKNYRAGRMKTAGSHPSTRVSGRARHPVPRPDNYVFAFPRPFRIESPRISIRWAL